RDGDIAIVIGAFSYAVTIKQESPQSTNDERAAQLMVDIGYHFQNRRSTWADRKQWCLEDVLGAILQELETRAADDRQREIDEERAKAERKIRWEAAMAQARAHATQAHYARSVREQADWWEQTQRLQAYR